MDRNRLVRFVQEDYARVVAAVGFACGDRNRAEDAVQDVLAVALDHDQRVGNLAGWVVTSALNRVRSSERKRGAELRAIERLGRQADARNPRTTNNRLGDADDEMLAALRSLPERQREITALHYLLDMSVADIAISLEVSDGTVKTQLHRARESLRTRFEGAPPTGTNDEEAGHVG